MLILSYNLIAQEKDYGIWSSTCIKKKYKKINYEINGELRTRNNTQDIKSINLKIICSYNLNIFNAGIGYQFIYFNDIEYKDYQPRQRMFAFISVEKNFNNLSILIRERFQRTIKDERDRIRLDGSYDTYRVNPEWEWRNRIKLSYYIRKTPINLITSFESFYCLSDPEFNRFNKLRYTIGIDYRLSKKHTLEIYCLKDKEINIKNPLTTYVTGISYKFKF